MRILVIGLIALGAVAASIPQAQSQTSARQTMANEADFRRAMKELSNWGRWGNDDELRAQPPGEHLPVRGLGFHLHYVRCAAILFYRRSQAGSRSGIRTCVTPCKALI